MTELRTTQPRNFLQSQRGQLLLTLILSTLWATFLAWRFRDLTFFWDEWNVLRDALLTPLSSIFVENGGNFFPLSRALFSVEVALLGSWYPGYIFVTTLLFGISASLLAIRVLRPTSLIDWAISAVMGIAYLLTTGVVFASSMGFMNLWPLSVLFAVLAALGLTRAGSDRMALGYASMGLVLSWLSHGTAILSNVLLFVAATLVIWARDAHTRNRSRKGFLIASAPAAAVAGLGAAYLAQITANNVGDSGSPLATLANFSDVIADWVVGTTAAIASAALVLPLVDFGVFTRAYLFLAANILIAIVSLLLTAAVSLILWRRGDATPFVLLALLALSIAFLALVRTPFIVRYEVLWAPLALLLVGYVLYEISTRRFGTVIVLAYLSVAAVIIASGTISLRNVADLERQRSAVDALALWNSETCMNESTKRREEISPSLTPEEICAVVERLAK